ncbi:unnamed protein product [Peronospora belbahrii]|uniref:Uncharacterized protein n=1 Tax=Peronospora belbahrii TaxID=622444 RepID=A0ABN8CMT2_9STRA|nr:unnamed protein product [Peronospora belbahrii]
MDPFGDNNAVKNNVPQEIMAFAPPAEISGDFYEVEPTEDALTNDAYGEDYQHTNESYRPTDFESRQSMDFGSQQPMDFGSQQPIGMHAGFQTEMETPASIPLVEDENELTKFMREYEKQIAAEGSGAGKGGRRV